jgi:hypothetical protein
MMWCDGGRREQDRGQHTGLVVTQRTVIKPYYISCSDVEPDLATLDMPHLF